MDRILCSLRAAARSWIPGARCWMPQLHLLRRRNAGGTLAVSHTPFSA
jgi:hypothetical protein